MRIIAGKHKGRRIELPRQAAQVRPTSGFARQAIFNILSHGEYAEANSPFIGNRVADIFCGSGAFGLEALSRGAAHATFVDMDAQSLLAARQNAERFGESARADFMRADAAHLPAAPSPYGLVFLDPPYFSGKIPACLNSLAAGNWVDARSVVVVEHDAGEQPAFPPAFALADERRYGRARVALLRLAHRT